MTLNEHFSEYIHIPSHSQQECIPVGCVPPTSVTTTRCQYSGGGAITEGHFQPEGQYQKVTTGPEGHSLRGRSSCSPPPPGGIPQEADPSHKRTWHQVARQEVT